MSLVALRVSELLSTALSNFGHGVNLDLRLNLLLSVTSRIILCL